jgi:hypothetical protein
MQTPFIIWLASLFILTFIHIARSPGRRSFKDILETFLLYFTVINIGLFSLYNFFAYLFFPSEVAGFRGYESSSPFQFELAMAYLAFGILGVLCFWERGDFSFATVIGFSLFLFGSGLGHLRDYIRFAKERSQGADILLYIDLILPLILLILTLIQRRLCHAKS